MYITQPGNYGDISLKGKDPNLYQADNPLRINVSGRVSFKTVRIDYCGMPLRHEGGDLYIETLYCTNFTADLFNSIGNLHIKNLIVITDGSLFNNYNLVHPDALGQFFNKKTGKVSNVHIENIYARIQGPLIQGMMLSEDQLYSDFQIGTGKVDIQIDYPYAFMANTLSDSYVNIGNNGIRIKNNKHSIYNTYNVDVVVHDKNQTVISDGIINEVKMKTKIALIIGHNPVSQGAVRKGVSEYMFWSAFFQEYLPYFNDKVKDLNIELRVFERRSFGPGTYGKEMRDVHTRVDEWGANISVECHYNGFSGKAEGHEVLHYKESKGGEIIANLFDNAMDTYLDNADRGRKPLTIGQNGSYGLKIGKAKSILIEPFFGQEIMNFLSKGNQRDNLVDTFIAFFYAVNDIDLVTDGVTKLTNKSLTDIEYEYAMELLK